MLIWILRIAAVAGGGAIGYFQIARGIRGILIGAAVAAAVVVVEYLVEKIALDTLIAAIVGAILGLIGAKLLDYTVFLVENQNLYKIMSDYSLLIKFMFAYLGVTLAVMKKNELDLLDRDILKRTQKSGAQIYLLDTSSAIDGRIADVISTNFLNGVLGVPKFILEELQSMADSSDSARRTKARRGLNIIAQIQKEALLAVKIIDKEIPSERETDLKLIRLAKELDARIITTDFNLNKLAALQGIVVLNINDLSNALRPVHLPGEKMQIYVAKEGKEREQGVGFLDDGTMVVVEDGRRFIGRRIDCSVVSLLQTSSGRMIFVKSSEVEK